MPINTEFEIICNSVESKHFFFVPLKEQRVSVTKVVCGSHVCEILLSSNLKLVRILNKYCGKCN